MKSDYVCLNSKTFLIGAIIHELQQQGLITITIETKEKIKDLIKQLDYESTLLVFKEEYNFDNLPEGYKLRCRFSL